MKKMSILIGCIAVNASIMITSKLHEVCNPEQLQQAVSNAPLAIVYFAGQQCDVNKKQGGRQQGFHKTFEELAFCQRYATAQIPFIYVPVEGAHKERFMRAYSLKKQVPIIQIFRNGRAVKDFRLVGYNNEETVKKFIEKKVGNKIDNLRDEQVNNETCPQWIHDWYFYWPYQYYGYAHPYYWHDGFHISFGC